MLEDRGLYDTAIEILADVAPPETKTYFSQSSFLLKIASTRSTTVLYMGDRWKLNELWDSRYIWMPLEIGGGKMRLPKSKPFRINAHTGEVRSPDPKFSVFGVCKIPFQTTARWSTSRRRYQPALAQPTLRHELRILRAANRTGALHR